MPNQSSVWQPDPIAIKYLLSLLILSILSHLWPSYKTAILDFFDTRKHLPKMLTGEYCHKWSYHWISHHQEQLLALYVSIKQISNRAWNPFDYSSIQVTILNFQQLVRSHCIHKTSISWRQRPGEGRSGQQSSTMHSSTRVSTEDWWRTWGCPPIHQHCTFNEPSISDSTLGLAQNVLRA